LILANISGPVIGAVIGYCTNYIAVKMLFRPRREIRICGHRLPFTPGAIPKGKPRLAKAAGDVVANTLLTEDDIRQKFLDPETEDVIINKIMDVLSVKLGAGIRTVCPDEEEYDSLKLNLSIALTAQIMESIANMDIKNLVVTEAKRAIKEKTAGTMLAMFVSDEMLDSLIYPVGEKLEDFIAENGADYIQAEINNKLDVFEQKSVMDLCGDMEMDEEKLRGMITSLYRTAAVKAVSGILKNINIAGMVEEKINAMDVKQLEEVVLAVMKKELNMIVRLGALVGGIIGIVNIFI